jgi:hypothetical protein
MAKQPISKFVSLGALGLLVIIFGFILFVLVVVKIGIEISVIHLAGSRSKQETVATRS